MFQIPLHGDADYPRWLTSLTARDLIKLIDPNPSDYTDLRDLLKHSHSPHAINLIACHDKQVMNRVVKALQDDTLRLTGDPTQHGTRIKDYLTLTRDHQRATSNPPANDRPEGVSGAGGGGGTQSHHTAESAGSTRPEDLNSANDD